MKLISKNKEINSYVVGKNMNATFCMLFNIYVERAVKKHYENVQAVKAVAIKTKNKLAR